MTVERNFSVQLGETWALPFEAARDLAGAALDFDLALGAVLKVSLSDAMSPSPFALNSPADSGVVTVGPGDQVGLVPETYLYEIRASFPDQTVAVVQFGRVIVSASLFAWPDAST